MSPGLITSAVMAITRRSTRIEGRLRPQPLSASRRPIPFPSPACGSRLRRSTQHGSPPVDTTGPTILSPSRASVDWSQRFRARLLARSEDRHSQSWAPRAQGLGRGAGRGFGASSRSCPAIQAGRNASSHAATRPLCWNQPPRCSGGSGLRAASNAQRGDASSGTSCNR
jgi:hypothetical protein